MMAIDKRKAKDDLLAALPPIFRDDVTGYPPQSETELTAMLGVLHQRRAIRWNRVPLYSPTYKLSGRCADALFADGGIMVCEYPKTWLSVIGFDFPLSWRARGEKKAVGSHFLTTALSPAVESASPSAVLTINT